MWISVYYPTKNLNIVRLLSDMGEALDWIRQISLENGWKALKIRIGPGVYLLAGNHPDAAQVMLRAGQL